MGDREQLMEILDADSMRPVGSTEDFLVRVRNDGDVFDNGPLADAIEQEAGDATIIRAEQQEG